MSFGKNRIQWKSFYWQYYRLEAYDIYFYQNGEELADYVNSYAQQQIPIFENKLHTHLSQKIQFVVFNSLGDFKQSNIKLDNQEEYNTGGVTHVINSKVLLYFDGNYVHFEQQIRRGLAQIMIQQMIYGSSIGSQIRNTLFNDMPIWFSNGINAYVADEWNSYMECRLQNGILSGKYENINRLEGEDARVAGCSFWKFIQEQYGNEAFTEIIKLTQSNDNIKKGLHYVTGVKYKPLMKQWYSFYKQRYTYLREVMPQQQLDLKYRNYRSYTQPRLSPDGQKMAYVSNDDGRIGLWIEDLRTGRKKSFFKTGFRSDEYVDVSYPLLAWHPAGSMLAAVIEEKGKVFLLLFDLEEHTQEQRYLFEFQKITSFSYSNNGRKLVLAATREGMPDIFVYDLIANRHEQITADYFTDLEPVFSADDKLIIFSSNRSNDTISFSKEIELQKNQFNLYAYDYAGKKNILQNLTGQTVSNNIKPQVVDRNTILYLNDTSGYFNVYEARFDSAISFIDTTIHYRHFATTRCLTNFSNSIIDYSYNAQTTNMALMMGTVRGERFYSLNRENDLSEGKSILQFSPMAQKRMQMKLPSAKKDSINKTIKQRFRISYRQKEKPVDSICRNLLSTYPRVENSFEQKQHYAKSNDSSDLQKRNYNLEFAYDKITSQIDFTYINYNYQTYNGSGSPIYLSSNNTIFLGTTLKDLMEDYRIEAGIKLNSSFVNNEYAISFSNLKNRIDKQITLHRVVTDGQEGSNYYTRTFSHEAYYMLSLPLSEILSLRGTAIFRNNHKVYLSSNDNSLNKADVYDYWGGLRGELVYDNSKKIGTNIYSGARGKLFGEYYQTISKNSTNFFVVGGDYRHYTRIHRNFIWANRIAASTSFGQSRLIYFMGGVDNWLLPSYNSDIEVDESQNYVYQTLATNMRGFSQNIRNGNSFVVINSELRFPVFSYLISTPLKNSFWRDFQIVAFGDVGTAWNGLNPYDKNSSLYTHHVEDGSLNISVTMQKEPIVGGVGFGLRTSIFGYFVRGDVAWGIEDYQVKNKPVYHLSFSLDF